MATPPKPKAAAPERTPVVLLFAETRGFTRTSAMLQAAVVVARISEFFSLVQKGVELHGGTVRVALNDTLMASFAGRISAQEAVKATQNIQTRFEAIAESWKQHYGIRASIAMALHTGEAVIGVADGPIAGQPLFIGDCVSITERLLHRARVGELLLSKPVVDALKATGFPIEAAELPALEIPRRDAIPLYGVLRDTRLDFT
jgi:class 3 adenylate cyclase